MYPCLNFRIFISLHLPGHIIKESELTKAPAIVVRVNMLIGDERFIFTTEKWNMF